MISEIPFSIVQSDVKTTSKFLIYKNPEDFNSRKPNEFEINKDLNLIKVIGCFTAISNTIPIRRRYESKIFNSNEITNDLISSYKKEWTEKFREHCKERYERSRSS